MTEITAASAGAGIKVWEKHAYHVARQGLTNATDIGQLVNNAARLNLVGKLSENTGGMDPNSGDAYYKFSVLTPGKLDFAYQVDENTVRIQILQQNGGRVIADSKADMGRATETFEAMTSGAYDAEAGTYIVRVTRDEAVRSTAAVGYALQVKLGKEFTNDYVTWEHAAATETEPPKPVMNPIVSALQSAINSIGNLFS